MQLHLLIGPALAPNMWSGPYGAILIAASGALVTAALAFANTNLFAWRQRRQQISAARLTVYAQLHRVAVYSHGQLGYLGNSKSPNYIWISIFELNLPSTSAAEAIKLLTANEVYEVTSFLYSYQEEMGYMLGNARTSKPERVDPPFLPPGAKVASPVFGYDTADPLKNEWLRDSIGKIERRARRARGEIGRRILLNYWFDRRLRALVRKHAQQDTERTLELAAAAMAQAAED